MHRLCQAFLLCVLTRSLSGRLYLAPSDKLTVSDDYDRTPYPKEYGPPFSYWEVKGTVNSTGRAYTAHVAVMSNGLPACYTYAVPFATCCVVNKTSDTAKAYGCTYATNGGFFDVDTGCCIGNVIINSTFFQVPGTARANFGLTADSFVSGYLTKSSLASLGFSDLISGAGWIVRRGVSYVNQSVKEEDINERFVTLKAPRTVIGAHSNGSLFLVQVDGVEYEKVGLDLYEMADVAISMGISQAVNLDGGGSSVSVYKGQVVSRPTCSDTPFICERAVSSITCIYEQ